MLKGVSAEADRMTNSTQDSEVNNSETDFIH